MLHGWDYKLEPDTDYDWEHACNKFVDMTDDQIKQAYTEEIDEDMEFTVDEMRERLIEQYYYTMRRPQP